LSVNRELIALYWDIGRVILQRQQVEGWGAKVVARLAADLREEFPEIKEFGESSGSILQQAVALSPATPPEPVASLPWGHNLVLLTKLKKPAERLWYAQAALRHGLCKEKNRLTVEYALRDMKKPIGVAEWKARLVESLPRQLRGALPVQGRRLRQSVGGSPREERAGRRMGLGSPVPPK
jgi:predicted nuclease of restriction endonuclease-like (RecB) superfamily